MDISRDALVDVIGMFNYGLKTAIIQSGVRVQWALTELAVEFLMYNKHKHIDLAAYVDIVRDALLEDHKNGFISYGELTVEQYLWKPFGVKLNAQ